MHPFSKVQGTPTLSTFRSERLVTAWNSGKKLLDLTNKGIKLKWLLQAEELSLRKIRPGWTGTHEEET
jgi:hypothetical protein